MDPNYFFDSVKDTVVSVCKSYNLPPSVCLSQMAQESDWGESKLVEVNNYLGMKWRGKGPYVEKWTDEWLPSFDISIVAGSDRWKYMRLETPGWWRLIARFRAFADLEECISAYCERILYSGYYDEAVAALPDVTEYARRLGGVYATDPIYTEKLMARCDEYNLWQYDN